MLWSEVRERKESTTLALPSQSNQCNGIHFPTPHMNWISYPSAGLRVALALFWIWSRERTACASLGCSGGVPGVPSVFPLNCRILAPVTSNKTLHIVYSNLWTRKSGFIWFSFFTRRSCFNLPILQLSLFHVYLYLSPCSSGLRVFPQGERNFLILKTADPRVLVAPS